MRALIVYWILLSVKTVSRLFYSYETQWVGRMPEDPWQDYRVVAILNHTSLFEFLYAGIVPNRFLLRMARYGVVPIADKTIRRPVIGLFWRLVAGNVVSITRERDQTWEKVLASIDPRSMVIILPEGRMKRADGRDAHGRMLRVRSGVADILRTIDCGKMLLAYSQGLHHIQIPDQGEPPNLYETLRMRLEALDIETYRAALRNGGGDFQRAVIDDFTRRRDDYCTSDTGARDEVALPVAMAKAARTAKAS